MGGGSAIAAHFSKAILLWRGCANAAKTTRIFVPGWQSLKIQGLAHPTTGESYHVGLSIAVLGAEKSADSDELIFEAFG